MKRAAQRLCLGLLAAAPLPGQAKDPGAGVAFAPSAGARVALDATFVGDTGERRTLGAWLSDRPAVLALVYYRCPMLCNLVVEGLERSLADVSLRPGKDYDVLLVSIDPRETAADAARRRELVVAASGGALGNTGWSFLCGAEPEIRALADSVGFRYAYDAASDQYAHGAGVVLLDRHGAITRFLAGIDFPSKDVELGLVESSAGASGSVIDQLLLLCYRWDPSTGKYGFAVLAALRVFGGLTVAGMGGAIAFMLWRERARRRATGSA